MDVARGSGVVELSSVWMLVLASCALTAWWLAVRPNASYRGVSGTMSFLIISLAVLLGILALAGQSGGPPAVGVALAP